MHEKFLEKTFNLYCNMVVCEKPGVVYVAVTETHAMVVSIDVILLGNEFLFRKSLLQSRSPNTPLMSYEYYGDFLEGVLHGA